MRHHQDWASPRARSRFVGSSTPNAGVLISEAIGLLLEDFGFDDTLTANHSVALTHDLAAICDLPDSRTGPIAAILANDLDRAAALLRARSELIADARVRGLEAGHTQIDAAQRILKQAQSTKTVLDLGGSPAQVETLALHEFDFEYRKLA